MEERDFIASVDELHNVLAFVESQLEELDCSLKSSMQIQVAVEELFVNIASYAYDSPGETMNLKIEDNGPSVSIVFTDHGKEFNPLAKQDPNTTLAAEDRKIGGLGIFMVKKTMDNVEYKYQSGQNILTITKNK